MQINQLMVAAVKEVTFHIEHIGEAARHTRTKVQACTSKDGYHTACHILAAVVACAFNHRLCA